MHYQEKIGNCDFGFIFCFVFSFSRGILRSFTLMTCGEGAFRYWDKVFRRYMNKLNRFTIAGKPSRARPSLANSEIPLYPPSPKNACSKQTRIQHIQRYAE